MASEGERGNDIRFDFRGRILWLAAGNSASFAVWPGEAMPQQALSIGGIAVVVLFGLIFRILLRKDAPDNITGKVGKFT
jgi:hypothetical protein